MREPPRYETAERLGLAPRSGFVQPFVQLDVLRLATPASERKLTQTLGTLQLCHPVSYPVLNHIGLHTGESYEFEYANHPFRAWSVELLCRILRKRA